MHDNDAIVSDFCAAWSRGDADAIVDAFTDDAVYHNIPMDPIVGRAAIDGVVRTFLAGGTVEFETLHQVANGDLVMNERIDRIARDGGTVELPVMGVFELRDGRIAAWRDYFDVAMWRAGSD